MTSNTPPARPDVQAQATPTTVASSNGAGRRQWLEPAVVVAVIGVAVTILGLLLSIVFGIYGMNIRIDALGADLSTRMDTLGSDLNTRIDTLSTRMDTLGSDLNARIDTLSTRIDTPGSDLNARIDTLDTRIDVLSTRMDKVYQLLLPEMS